MCNGACVILSLLIRWILSSENKRRDREPVDHTYDNVYLERMNDGVVGKVKIDKVCPIFFLFLCLQLTVYRRNSLT